MSTKVYVIKSTIIATVEADSKAEALEKLHKGECEYISRNPEILGKLDKEA